MGVFIPVVMLTRANFIRPAEDFWGRLAHDSFSGPRGHADFEQLRWNPAGLPKLRHRQSHQLAAVLPAATPVGTEILTVN